MELTSSAFSNYTMMPRKYTCQGDEINPPLTISGIPEETKSLVLIVTDPDTPFPLPAVTHWIVCNIDPKTTTIDENYTPKNTIICKNVYRRNNYVGPCPPWGTHKYIFTLYALNKNFEFNEKMTRRKILKMIQNNIIAQAELIGLYTKRNSDNK